MEVLGQYVRQLIASATICGILLSLSPEGVMQKLLRLICGIFLAVMVLMPLPGMELPELTIYEETFSQGELLAHYGEEMAADAVTERITQAFDAYILDKAAAMTMDVVPETAVDAEGVPVKVILRGNWTVEAQQALAAIITKDLGVPEEDQQWIQENGENESENGS